MRFVSSAATRNVNAPRSASIRAALIGLPASSAIVRAKSSVAASIPSAIRESTSARRHAGSLRVTSNARTAPAIAASISAGPARWMTATSASSYGLRTS